MSRRLANIHFSGEIETKGLAAQLPQVCEGSTWTVAPDVIWRINSRLSCSKRDGGINFQSSWHTSPPKSLRASSQPSPLHTIQMVTCNRWPHTCPTLPQKQLSDSPSIQGVERGFVQKGSLPFQCYCSLSCGQMSSNFGGSPWPDWKWDLDVLFRDCCPTLFLSGLGDPTLVAPPGGALESQRGAPSEGKKLSTSPPPPVSLAGGVEQGCHFL